jgi:hypothetical protein
VAYKDPKTFERQVVRLCELIPKDEARLKGYTFTECQIYGPAILAFQGTKTVISNNWFDGRLDAILWEVRRPDRGHRSDPRCRLGVFGMHV